MFWEKSVKISQEMYQHSLPIFYICRFSGYLPLAVKHVGSKVSLKWSPYYALYSFILGTALIGVTSWELYHTYFMERHFKSSTTTKIILCLGQSGWKVIYFIGVFVTANKFLTFFIYIKTINEIDDVIKTLHKRSDKYLWVFIAVLAPISCVLYAVNAAIQYMLRGYKAMDYVTDDMFYYISLMFATTAFYNIGYLIHTLKKRLIRLNELIELKNQNYKNMEDWVLEETREKSIGVIKSQDGKTISHRPMKMFNIEEMVKNYKSNDCEVLQLAKIYLKLCDAADLLNELLGASMAFGTAFAFMQVVQPTFFFINNIRKPQFVDGTALLTLSLLGLFRNIICVALIIESVYGCSMQVKSVERLVCGLFYWNSNLKYRFQVKTFAVCLGLRKLQFSPGGFFTIGRFLYSNMIGNVITLMFLLLAMQDREDT